MSIRYSAIQWNRQKRRYDFFIAGGVLLYLACFAGLAVSFAPQITIETLVLRATGSLALIMLHVILVIGPLSRFSPRFMPFLYNRRHLGVAMFCIALIHGTLAIIQFHTLGDTHPLVSIFTANDHYPILGRFPFQPLGFCALLILFIMGATSHDFWLKNLTPAFWKTMHMLVYLAYALLVGHLVLGTLQYETFTIRFVLIGMGVIAVVGAHIAAAFRERVKRLKPVQGQGDGNYRLVCEVSDIPEDRARIVHIDDEEIAIFRYDSMISAVHNLCKHQNGPLGEGKIIEGCITCPWHGYQYLPASGTSPPPFKEMVHTYRTKVIGRKVFVDPTPLPEGTFVEPTAAGND